MILTSYGSGDDVGEGYGGGGGGGGWFDGAVQIVGSSQQWNYVDTGDACKAPLPPEPPLSNIGPLANPTAGLYYGTMLVEMAVYYSIQGITSELQSLASQMQSVINQAAQWADGKTAP